jgi:hypothetical protein
MTDDQIKELIERLGKMLTDGLIANAFENRTITDGRLAEHLIHAIGDSKRALSTLLQERERLRELVQQREASDKPQCVHPVSEKQLGQIAYEAAKPHLSGAPVAWCDARMDADWRQAWHIAASAVRLAVIEECAKVADVEAEACWGNSASETAAEHIAKDIRSLSATTSGDRTVSAPRNTSVEPNLSIQGNGEREG